MRRIVTCTVNPAIDISAEVERIEPFRKLRCGAARRDPGGGGINVARVLERFGVPAAAIYPAGGPTGELLRRLVVDEGIESIPIPIAGETREDFTVDERESGRQFRFVLPGPALAPDECKALVAALEGIEPRPAFAVASGSLPPGVAPSLYAELIRAAKSAGAEAVVDTSGAALEAALAEGVHLVKPNLRELRELTRSPLESEAQWLEAARSLVTTGSARIVALTLGEHGALLAAGEGAWRARAPRVKVASTVGAGDSFLGAMVYSLASGSGPGEGLRLAVAAGTAALLSPGTELCRREDVLRLLPEVEIEELSGARA